MIQVNGTETLAFSVKSEHQLVRKGSFLTQKVARKPSSITLMFANNIDPNTLDDTVGDSTPGKSAASAFEGGDAGGQSMGDVDTEEKIAFCEHLNNVLKDDKSMTRYIPLDPYSDDLYSKLDDGVILCKLINFAVPGTIDERAVNKKANLNIFQKTENVNLALGAAANIGCRLVNVGAQDIISGRPRLILGVVWQIIKIQLMSKISFKNVPNLTYLLEAGEDKSSLSKLSGESILLRWVNYHIKRTRVRRIVTNFSRDFMDCVVYNTLLRRLDKSFHRLRSDNMFSVAQHLIDFVVNEFDIAAFISPPDILNGNAKLNMGFLAQIFAEHPNLDELNDAQDEYEDEMSTSSGIASPGGSLDAFSPRNSSRKASFSDIPVLPSPSSTLTSPTNTVSQQQSSLSSSPSVSRNLPRSSSFLTAGTPRSGEGKKSKFFGDEDTSYEEPVKIPATVAALVSKFSTPQQSPVVQAGTPQSSQSSASRQSSFLITSAGATKSADDISCGFSASSTPRVSTPRSPSVARVFGGIEEGVMKSNADEIPSLVTKSPRELSVLDGSSPLTDRTLSSVVTNNVPSFGFGATSSTTAVAVLSGATAEDNSGANVGDNASANLPVKQAETKRHFEIPKLDLDTNIGQEDLINSLCDYEVADDLSSLDGNEGSEFDAPKRTFLDGYFGHNHTNKNFTESSDFEIDEDMALLRWVNTQLERADSKRRITNFTYDLSDSLVYGTLLNYMAPDVCPPLDRSGGILVKAQFIVDCAAVLGLPSSITAADICNCSMTKNRAFIVDLVVYQRTQNIKLRNGLPSSLPRDMQQQPHHTPMSSPSASVSTTAHPSSVATGSMEHNLTFSNLRIGGTPGSNHNAYQQMSVSGFHYQQVQSSPENRSGSGNMDGDDSTLSSLGDYNNNQQFVMSEEAILLWANKLLRRCGYHRSIKSFEDDLSSCEVYGLILHALDPVNCKLPDLDKDAYLRACTVLDNAAFLNVVTFIEPTDLISYSPSITKLFLTNLYEDVRDSDENTVIRWLNYQLYKAGVPRIVENLGSDLQDLVVYSSLLHFIANSPKPEKDRIMSAEEIIRRINYICPLDFHVTPSDILNGDVHANVEMLSKLCSRLTVVSQNRNSNILRQSLIPTKRSTMKARLAGSPGSSALAPPVPVNAIPNMSSGRPPASPFSRKAPMLTGLAGRGVSHVRTPRSSSADGENSSLCSVDSHDTLKRPLGRWPECLQNNDSRSPYQRKLAPPRELANSKSFLEKTKSQQDLLLKLDSSGEGDVSMLQGRFLQSTASQPGVPSATKINSARSSSPTRAGQFSAAASGASSPLPGAAFSGSNVPVLEGPLASPSMTKAASFSQGTSTPSAPSAPNSTSGSTPPAAGARKLTSTLSASTMTKKPSFLLPTQSSSASAYVSPEASKLKAGKELHRSKSWVSGPASASASASASATSSPSTSPAAPKTPSASSRPPIAPSSKPAASTDSDSAAATHTAAATTTTAVAASSTPQQKGAASAGNDAKPLLRKTSSFLKANAASNGNSTAAPRWN